MWPFVKSLRVLKNKHGMTLIEIMIVVGIIAFLMAAIGTTVMGRLKKVRQSQAKILISEIGKALDQFYTDCGFYPSSEQGLKALTEPTSECQNWGPEPYIKKIQKDPWNTEFIYEGKGSSYTMKSLGADRKEGGAGADADISSENL